MLPPPPRLAAALEDRGGEVFDLGRREHETAVLRRTLAVLGDPRREELALRLADLARLALRRMLADLADRRDRIEHRIPRPRCRLPSGELGRVSFNWLSF